MRDPIGAYERLKDGIIRYVETAFGTSSETFERDRRNIFQQEGAVFREPYIEVLPEYQREKLLRDLGAEDLPTLDQPAISAFRAICSAGLFPGDAKLYTHQQQMLKSSLAGQHCVVTTGTGSGKTESFLLPLLASIISEMKGWSAARPVAQRPANWWDQHATRWDSDKRLDCWGETRPAALRSIVLYPMNALVEDQLSRLRDALDFDDVHYAYANHEDYFKSNRITFARYNGETPVAGHPFKVDGTPNNGKRGELRRKLRERRLAYTQLRQELQQAQNDEQRERILELMSFFPRVDDQSNEMIHRWEVQRTPPDILITNFSMLSIMLMRQAHPQVVPGDQADGEIFEKTRVWLQNDPYRSGQASQPTRKFHLIVDELHLYRGTAGTEVAYLIRLLLERLGLAPDSAQLKILASSASLSDTNQETYSFLGQFFGIGSAATKWSETRQRFAIIAGKHVDQHGHGNSLLPKSVVEKCVAGEPHNNNHMDEIRSLLQTVDGLALKFKAACSLEGEQRPFAVPLSKFAERMLGIGNERGARCLLSAMSLAGTEIEPVRFRMHWLSKCE